MGFVDPDIVIQLQPFPLLPLKRGEHKLIFSNRSAEKNWDIAETFGRRLVNQIGDLLVEGAIENHAERAVFSIVRRDEKHRAPKIRIEHIRMGDEQRTRQAQRHSIPKVAHEKLECPCSGRASAFRLFLSNRARAPARDRPPFALVEHEHDYEFVQINARSRSSNTGPSTFWSRHCMVVAVTSFCASAGKCASKALRRIGSSSPKISSINSSGRTSSSCANNCACAIFNDSATVRCWPSEA